MPISIVFEVTASPIDLFLNEFLLKHSNVSHSIAAVFLVNSVAIKGFPTSVYFLVLGAAQRGYYIM